MNTIQLHKIAYKTSKEIQKAKSLDSQKLQGFVDRLLKRDLKQCFKPLLVIYLTHETQREIQKHKNAFIEAVKKNVNDNFYILILPCFKPEHARAELWQKGKMLQKFHQQLFENNIWTFHELRNMQLNGDISKWSNGKVDLDDLRNVQGMMDKS